MAINGMTDWEKLMAAKKSGAKSKYLSSDTQSMQSDLTALNLAKQSGKTSSFLKNYTAPKVDTSSTPTTVSSLNTTRLKPVEVDLNLGTTPTAKPSAKYTYESVEDRINNYQTDFDNVVKHYGATQGKDGTWTFQTQEGLDAANKLQQEMNEALADYTGYYGTAEYQAQELRKAQEDLDKAKQAEAAAWEAFNQYNNSTHWSQVDMSIMDALSADIMSTQTAREEAETKLETLKYGKEYVEKYGVGSGLQGVDKGVISIAKSIGATPGVIAQTGKAAYQEGTAENADPEVLAARQKKEAAQRKLDNYMANNMGFLDLPEQAAEVKRLSDELAKATAELKAAESKHAVALDMNTKAMQNMKTAGFLADDATSNLSGFGKDVADAALSVGQNLAFTPVAFVPVVGQGLALAGMSATAAAQGMYEQGAEGKSAGDAFQHGIAVGAIEALTEKIPLDNLADMVKTGGKNFVVNLLKQAGIEATEEGISYTMNYILDKAEGDPNAKFDEAEFWQSVKVGGLSGMFFATGGTVLNKAVTPARVNANIVDIAEVQQVVAQAKQYDTPEIAEALGGLYNQGKETGSYTKDAVNKVVKAVNEAVQNGVTPLQTAATTLEAAAAATRVANPQAEVLDAGTTLYLQVGKNLKTAMEKSAVVLKLIEGKEVTPKELNKINLTDKTYQQIFTQLTGVEFPADVKLSTKMLRELAESAAAVTRQTTAQENPAQMTGNVVENQSTEGYTGANNNTEVAAYGEQAGAENLHLRGGSQRNDGQNPGGPVRQLEEAAGRDPGRSETEYRPRDEETTSLSYGSEVSTAELGLKGGSRRKTMRLIKGGQTGPMKQAKALAKKHGLKVVFFSGSLEMKNGDRARGCIDKGTLYIRVDHPDFTADQIARHEIGHHLIRAGEISLDKVRERLHQVYSEAELDKIVDDYLAAYNGVTMTAEEAFEEIVCDALGGMNIFAGEDITEHWDGVLTNVYNASVTLDPNTQKALNDGSRIGIQDLSAQDNQARFNQEGLAKDALNRVYKVDPAQHISRRTSESVGDTRVNAFQFDHPELHRYIAQAAEALMRDASGSIQSGAHKKTERTMQGKKTTLQIETTHLLDMAMAHGLSRNEIMTAAQQLIDSGGQENNANAKRIELVLDEYLTEGDFDQGEYIPPNEDYINARNKIPGYQERVREQLPLSRETKFSREGNYDDRARQETRADFLRRAAGEGYAIFEGDRIAHGYRPVQGESAQENARQVQEEVKRLGIDAEIIEGPILWNLNGITSSKEVPQAVTVGGRRIFISNSADLPPRNMAGHEAFHLWKNGTGRKAYIETVEDNLLFTSEDFLFYQSVVAEAYLGGEVDLTNDVQMAKLHEELFAYISGDIHEGVNDEYLRPMFRDFDAVKQAWQELIRANAPDYQFDNTNESTPATGEDAFSLPKFSRETDRKYRDAVENGDIVTAQRMVDEAAKEAGYVQAVFHGTDEEFNRFDRNIAKQKAAEHRWLASYPAGTIFLAGKRSTASGYGNRRMDLYLDTSGMKTFKHKNMYAADAMDQLHTGDISKYPVIAVEGSDDIIYATLSGSRVKRTDAAIYDDNGNLIPLSKRFNKGNSDIRFSRETTTTYAPTFYSKMEQVIDEMKLPRLGAANGVNYLKGRGVRDEEIKWSGIEEFFADKKSVSKEELQEFVRNNQLQIEETALSYGPSYTQKDRETLEQADKDFTETVEKINSLWETLFGERIPDNTLAADRVAYTLEQESYKKLVEFAKIHPEAISDPTRQKQLSDDLLKMHSMLRSLREIEIIRDDVVDKAMNRNQPKYGEYRSNYGTSYREILFTLPGMAEGSFQSQHWDQDNVVAHARLADATDTDGNSVLFVEEVQSDWHERGREAGYRKAGEKTDQMLRRESDKAYKEFYEAVEKMVEDNSSWEDDNSPYYAHPVVVAEMFMGDESNFGKFKFTDEQKVAIRAMVAEEAARQDAIKNAPKHEATLDAPFRNTWHEYVLKRIIRMAAEGGYDKVAWTTGQMQADRYGLQNQVSKIWVEYVGDGRYVVVPEDRHGDTISAGTIDNGTENDIYQIYGRDLGNKLIEKSRSGLGGGQYLEGMDLQLGGEGMKNFYDVGGKSSQNIPKFLNKYVSKWGSKVDMTEMEDGAIVPSIEVTDAMRESVLYEGQPKFSREKPVEQVGSLIALHNLNAGKLNKVLDLGGFPMPSIAVTRTDIPHTNFGDITLVMNKSAIDPKANRKNTVYSADAWTPTVPPVSYKPSEKRLREIKKTVYDLVGGREVISALDHISFDEDNISRALDRYDGDLVTGYRDNNTLRYAFLKDSGADIELPVEEADLDGFHMYSNAAVRYFTGKLVDGLRTVDMYQNMGVSALLEDAELKEAVADVRNWEVLQNFEPGSKAYQVLVAHPKFKAENVSFSDINALLSASRRYFNGGTKQTVKRSEASNLLRRHIADNGLQEQYEAWLAELFDGVVEKTGIYNNKDIFTPSGNRRSFEQLHMPVTLENIVKAMASQNGGNTKNVAGFNGVKTLRAGMAKRFKSIAEMHKLEERLQNLTEEEFEAIHDQLSERMFAIINRIIETGPKSSGNSFMRMDSVGEMMMEIAESGNYSLDNIVNTYKKYQYNVGTDLANDVKVLLFDVSQMPTNMFEAKPERVVGFDEVLAAIVPDDTDQSLISRLKDAGVMKVTTYAKGDDTDRLVKVNDMPEALFSREPMSKEAVKAVAERWAQLQAQTKPGDFHPEGANGVREVRAPKYDFDDKPISKSVATVMGARAIPDDVVVELQEMAANGDFSYGYKSDEKAIQKAKRTINSIGFEGAMERFRADVNAGKMSKDIAVLGQVLLNNAANSGDSKAVAELMCLYQTLNTHAGQTLQAMSIFRKLEPESQLYGVQKMAEKLTEEIKKKHKKAFEQYDIQIDKGLIDKFLAQKDQDGRDAVMDEIYQNIADQIPSTWMDKWNAWRYLAMLGNLRTHGRNIVGNLAFQPVVLTKDVLATLMESAVYHMGSKKRGMERTKAFTVDPALYQAAWNDFGNAKKALEGNKYNDTQSVINDKRRIFRFKPLEAVRKFNSGALGVEDAIFKRMTYTYSLASYLKAHGVSGKNVNEIDPDLMSKARDYAGGEALKATYNDENALSSAMGRLSGLSKSDKAVVRAAGVVVEGALPFKKTPANILVRGLEYSPIGLAKGLTYDLVKVAKGEKTAAEAIDAIASGLSGSALFVLGIVLAAMGRVTGGAGEDKDDEWAEQLGHQAYALELDDGTSVTLDWMAPEALPFFMGVELLNTIGENGFQVDDIWTTAKRMTNPLMEMSMLQSLNDLLDTVSYSDSKLTDIVLSALISYVSQGVPTLGGQIERTGEEVRTSTYTDKTNTLIPSDVQYAIGKASAKIPGWDYQQVPYIDVWGQTESTGTAGERAFNNFLSPAYTSQIEADAVESELQRLRESQSDAAVYPSKAKRYIEVNNERIDLTAEQYVTYATTLGQTRYSLLADGMDTDAYRNMTDVEKAEYVSKVYTFANAVAKMAVSDYTTDDKWIHNTMNAQKEIGVSPAEYLSLYVAADNLEGYKYTDRDGKQQTVDNSQPLKVAVMVYDCGYDEETTDKLLEALGVSKTVRGWNPNLARRKLEQMEKKYGTK